MSKTLRDLVRDYQATPNVGGLATALGQSGPSESGPVINFGHEIAAAKCRVDELEMAIAQASDNLKSPERVLRSVTVAHGDYGYNVVIHLEPKEVVALVKAKLAEARKHYRGLQAKLAKVNEIIAPKR